MEIEVEHPTHYADKEIEVIDYIKDTLTQDEFIGFCMGNVLKYVSRWRKKGGITDLKKARYYLKSVIRYIENHSAKQVKRKRGFKWKI